MYFVVVFESIFEKRLRLGKLCNDSRLYKNVYKVLDFWKYLMESVGAFEKVFVFEDEQATRKILLYSKVFCSFLSSFDITILPLIGKKPYLWM